MRIARTQTIGIHDGFRAITGASNQHSLNPSRNPSAMRPRECLKTQKSAQSQAIKKATSLAVIKLFKSPPKGSKNDMFLPCKGIGGYFGSAQYNSNSEPLGVRDSDGSKLIDAPS
jgi:hypothetical protein